MSFHCKTCNLDFTTSSNIRKHERTEKHITKSKLISTVVTTSEQKIKDLEEKLENSQHKINLQEQVIKSYKIILNLTGYPVDQVGPIVSVTPVAPVVPDNPVLPQAVASQELKQKKKTYVTNLEPVHNATSMHCIMNAEQNKCNIEIIKNYFLLQELDSDNCLHFDVLSKLLKITIDQCKLLYREIPRYEWTKRPFDLRKHMESFPVTSCQECEKQVSIVQCNTLHTWKEKKICDTCYSKHAEEREQMWRQIEQYRKIECSLCLSMKQCKEECYHFDHINMFDKENGIYSMVSDGRNMEDIHKEVDKCQVLCISCHHMVTSIERKTGFMDLKRDYTAAYLKQPENEELNRVLQEKYHKVMTPIYVEMRQIIQERK